MTRDRFKELLTIRDKNVTVDFENKVTETENKHLRKTFEKAEILSQLIEVVEKNINNIRHMKQNDLRINHRDLDDEIEEIFVKNTTLCLKINRKLKEFAEELKTTIACSAEERIKSIQYNTLRKRYIKIFKENNAELENFRNIQKANLKAQLRAKGIQLTNEELNSILEEKTDLRIFTEIIIEETPESEQSLADIEKQYRQCLKIGQTLNEVSDSFIQMAILVDAQQDMVDRIEYQTQLAKEVVGRTPSILNQAAKNKTRYMKCQIYCVFAIIVLLIIMLIPLFKYLLKK